MTASCDLSSFDQRVGYLAVLRVVTIFDRFLTTVCKTVRPMLSDRCLFVLSCLSVCL